MDDVMQQQPMPPAPASLPAGAEDLLASARASGAAAAVKDVSAGAAAAVLATVSAKAAAAAGRGLMAGSEAAQCPSRTLRAVAAAADRIDRLEGLLADVLERAVRSEGDADEAAERSAAAMQVRGWEGEEKRLHESPMHSYARAPPPMPRLQHVAALEATIAAQAAVLRQREERISSLLLAAAAAPAPCATPAITSDDPVDLAPVAAQAPAPPLQQQQVPVSRLVQPKATGLRRPSATTVSTAAPASSSLGSTSASAAPTATKAPATASIPAKSIAPSTGAAAASTGGSTRIPSLTVQAPPGGVAPSKNPATGRRPSLSTMASGTAQLAGRRVSSSSAAAAGAAAAAVAAEQVAAEVPDLRYRCDSRRNAACCPTIARVLQRTECARRSASGLRRRR